VSSGVFSPLREREPIADRQPVGGSDCDIGWEEDHRGREGIHGSRLFLGVVASKREPLRVDLPIGRIFDASPEAHVFFTPDHTRARIITGMPIEPARLPARWTIIPISMFLHAV
jgi:hypothetical protein